MKIVRTVKVSAPVDKAWDLIGPQFSGVDRWASNVYVSKPKSRGHAPAAAPTGGRFCETPQGSFDESIVAYDEDSRRVAYSVTGKSVPGFVKSIRATWQLRAAASNVSEVTMTMDAVIAKPFEFLMGWMMKKQFGKAIDETLEEYRYFLERNQIHPRKTKVNQSKKARKARAAA